MNLEKFIIAGQTTDCLGSVRTLLKKHWSSVIENAGAVL